MKERKRDEEEERREKEESRVEKHSGMHIHTCTCVFTEGITCFVLLGVCGGEGGFSAATFSISISSLASSSWFWEGTEWEREEEGREEGRKRVNVHVGIYK